MDRMQAFKARLQHELEETQTRIAQLRQRLETKADYGPGSGDPAIYQWEFNLAMLEQAEAQAQEVRAALARVDAGTYGLCEKCGAQIEDERLEIVPLSKQCSHCMQPPKQRRRSAG